MGSIPAEGTDNNHNDSEDKMKIVTGDNIAIEKMVASVEAVARKTFKRITNTQKIGDERIAIEFMSYILMCVNGIIMIRYNEDRVATERKSTIVSVLVIFFQWFSSVAVLSIMMLYTLDQIGDIMLFVSMCLVTLAFMHVASQDSIYYKLRCAKSRLELHEENFISPPMDNYELIFKCLESPIILSSCAMEARTSLAYAWEVEDDMPFGLSNEEREQHYLRGFTEELLPEIIERLTEMERLCKLAETDDRIC